MTLEATLQACVIPGKCSAFVYATEANLRVHLEEISRILSERYENVGVCRYHRALFEDLSILDNVFVVRYGDRRMSRKAKILYLRDLCQRIGFHMDINLKLKQLSEVEKYIVELIRIMVSSPDVIVLHYSVSIFGDTSYQIFERLLDYFFEKGIPVVILTNQWEEMISICKKIVVNNEISGEHIILDTQQVRKNPQSVPYAMSGYQDVQYEGSYMNAIEAVYSALELFEVSQDVEADIHAICALASREVKACSCVVYIKNSFGTKLYRSISEEAAYDALKEAALADIFSRYDHGEHMIVFRRGDRAFDGLFERSTPNAQMIVCNAIGLPPHMLGTIVLTFDQPSIPDEYYTVVKTICYAAEEVLRQSQMFNNSVLMQESNHRVKNNYQMMVSYLYIRKMELLDSYAGPVPVKEMVGLLDEVVNEIKVYSKLHDMISGRLQKGRIEIKELIEEIISCYQSVNCTYVLEISRDVIAYERATVFAMIVNELICNCLKHAFARPGQGNQRIAIRCRTVGGRFELSVCDNGVGLPETFDAKTAGSTGMYLLRTLCRQLKADIDFKSDNGTTVTVRFEDSLLNNGGYRE